MTDVSERLEYLRGEIEAERISMMEIVELQGYGDEGLIPDNEIELLQWAGVPEFPDEVEASVTLISVLLVDAGGKTDREILEDAASQITAQLMVDIDAFEWDIEKETIDNSTAIPRVTEWC